MSVQIVSERMIKACEDKKINPSDLFQKLAMSEDWIEWFTDNLNRYPTVSIGNDLAQSAAIQLNVDLSYLCGNDLSDDLEIAHIISSGKAKEWRELNPKKSILLDESEGMTDKSLEQTIRMMRVIKGMQD